MAEDKITTLEPPQPDPFNLQHVKHFVFNETGNIMMSSTDDRSDTIQQSVRDVFNEVSVFFAAMTKAISQTRNPFGPLDPVTRQPPYYTLYNYDALESVIDGSGFFVHVNEQDVQYSTKSWGVNFSKELFEALLGLAAGSGALGFASAMVASMGKEGLNIAGQTSERESKVANIVFVCEYLLGLPIVSAVVITVDAAEASHQYNIGPCFRATTAETKLKAHKDIYMFVTPNFIKQYSGDLVAGANDPEYHSLIMYLQGLVERTPQISGVWDLTNPSSPLPMPGGSTLQPGRIYSAFGQFLGKNAGTAAVSPANPELLVDASAWDDAGIAFKVENRETKATTKQYGIEFTLEGGTTKVSTAGFFIGK
jgi:hypothetical protein